MEWGELGKVCQTQKNVLIKTKPKSNVIHTKRDIELCVCVMMSEPVSISLHESSSKSVEEEGGGNSRKT